MLYLDGLIQVLSSKSKICWQVMLLLFVISIFGSVATAAVSFNVTATTIQIAHDGQSFDVSLTCPRFVFSTTTGAVTTAENIAPISIVGDISSGQIVTTYYSPIGLNGIVTLELQLLLQWSPTDGVLRKWAHYCVKGNTNGVMLQEIILEKTAQSLVAVAPFANSPQSYPAFANGFFLGIEFPISSTRIESTNLILGHKPGLRPVSYSWYDSRKAIYGVAALGKEKKAFLDYITLNRPQPTGLHINYNSWWSTAATESNIRASMLQFYNNLTVPYGVAFDTYTIDHGWSNTQSIWEINTSPSAFPNGFTTVQSDAQSYGMSMGLWSSPSAMYPGALDTTWAMNNGYETYSNGTSRFACMAGNLYKTAYTNKLVNYATLYGIKQYKFDGYDLSCPASNHGHEPGVVLGSEAMAQAGVNAFQAIHAVSPNALLEATCFSWGKVGSPWWLFYVNSITGAFGDDAPAGKIPCPIYRESYTTARDYYNLQGASLSPVPIAGQEVLGIIHQTTEPFLNDGIITVMRGHAFLPLYINPSYMSGRWSALAQLLTWARNNSGTILANTYPLIPASWENGNVPQFTSWAVMPREIYGYAHCVNNQGLVVLRNPWIQPQTYTLTLDEGIGFDSQAAGLSAVSLYPENRVYGQSLNYGNTVTFSMAPYETIVLTIGSGYNLNGIPAVENSIGGRLQTSVTGPGSCNRSNFTVNLQATVDSNAPNTKLLVLMEGSGALANPTYQSFTVNGAPASVQVISSESGWNATGVPIWEHWKFLQVNLTAAHNVISLEQLQPDPNCTNVSIWAWATKSGSGTPSFSNSLPSPELISLDAALLGSFDRVPASPSLGDINGDCNVDLADLAILATHWLEGMSISELPSSIIDPNTITPTACSSITDYEAKYAVNGAGLVGDMHDPLAYHKAWLSNMQKGTTSSAAPNSIAGEAWFKVEFNGVYSLDKMLVWNYNFGPNNGERGMKNVYIQCSVDGITWTTVMNGSSDFWTFARAPNAWNYLYNTTVTFNGMKAKYVAITAPAGGDGQWYNEGYYGLSELRFYGTQVAASVIDSSRITATASSFISPYDPVVTINGSGLTGDLHDEFPNTAWLSNKRGVIDRAAPGTTAGREWLLYQFDTACNLDKMYVWNYNYFLHTDRGLKEVYIEYSADGSTWTKLMNDANDFWTIAKAPGIASYACNTTVDFKGAKAKFVAITPKTGYEGQWGSVEYYYGLSEVRFYELPSCPTGDLNGDCTVDFTDFSILASDWLE